MQVGGVLLDRRRSSFEKIKVGGLESSASRKGVRRLGHSYECLASGNRIIVFPLDIVDASLDESSVRLTDRHWAGRVSNIELPSRSLRQRAWTYLRHISPVSGNKDTRRSEGRSTVGERSNSIGPEDDWARARSQRKIVLVLYPCTQQRLILAIGVEVHTGVAKPLFRL